MKKTVNVGIGGCSFIMDEDAYARLDTYLGRFRASMNAREAPEVMEDIEQRIAELFNEQICGASQVINIVMVDKVISQLGYPDSEDASQSTQANAGGASNAGNGATNNTYGPKSAYNEPIRKRLYRDGDNTVLGGVCSGLGAYFNIDPVIMRIAFVVAFICGSFGFWVYVILWIAVPKAVTPAEKCEMRGWSVTADNMRQFSNKR